MSRIASTFDRLLREQGGWVRGLAPLAIAVCLVGGASVYHHVGHDPSVLAGGCAVATQYVPDGPDNAGGCFPGTSNTGPDAPKASMADYSGSCTVSVDNTTIDSKVITCSPSLIIAAQNVTISNSYIMNGVTQDQATDNFTIEDSLLDNAVEYPACSSSNPCDAGLYACGDPNNQTTDCGVTGSNFDVYRTEIINTNRAVYCESPGNCTIQDNYFHGTNLWPDETDLAHASSVRNEQNLTISHNTLACDFEGPFPPGDELGCSADISGYPDFVPIHDDTITGNLFIANNIGAGFCVYGGGTSGKPFSSDPQNATNIVYTDNVFQKGDNGTCGTFGPVTDFITGRTGNVWSGNIYDDGTTVDPA